MKLIKVSGSDKFVIATTLLVGGWMPCSEIKYLR